MKFILIKGSITMDSNKTNIKMQLIEYQAK